MNTLILEDTGGGLFILRLNRPAQLNALNIQMLDDLTLLLDDLTEKKLRGLIITGTGSKAFAAGADILEMSGMNPEQAHEFCLKGNRIFRRIEMLPVPVIAAVNGYALGGGCELAMSCDIILCSSNAVFGQPETGLGICPGFGGTLRLKKKIGMQAAKEMLYSGRLVKADEAVRLGLALRQYPSEELMPETEKLMRNFLKNSASAVSAAKMSMNRTEYLPMEQAIAVEAECFSECFRQEDQKERMKSYLDGHNRAGGH